MFLVLKLTHYQFLEFVKKNQLPHGGTTKQNLTFGCRLSSKILHVKGWISLKIMFHLGCLLSKVVFQCITFLNQCITFLIPFTSPKTSKNWSYDFFVNLFNQKPLLGRRSHILPKNTEKKRIHFSSTLWWCFKNNLNFPGSWLFILRCAILIYVM